MSCEIVVEISEGKMQNLETVFCGMVHAKTIFSKVVLCENAINVLHCVSTVISLNKFTEIKFVIISILMYPRFSGICKLNLTAGVQVR